MLAVQMGLPAAAQRFGKDRRSRQPTIGAINASLDVDAGGSPFPFEFM